MRAQAFADPTLRGTVALRFNGAVDENHGYTPSGHATHDLGMAFDLGVSHLITTGQTVVTEGLIAALVSQTAIGWDNAAAVTLANLLTDAGGNNQRAAVKNFLSLYAVTQNVNGSWTGLPIASGTNPDQQRQIRTALFGGGTVATGLISDVLNGGNPAVLANLSGWTLSGNVAVTQQAGNPWYAAQNPYRNVRLILSKLGVPHNTDPNPNVATSNLAVTYQTVYKNGQSKVIYRWQQAQAPAVVPNGFGGRPDHQNHFHVYLRPPAPIPVTSSEQHLLADESGKAWSEEASNMFVVDQPVVPLLATAPAVLVAQAQDTPSGVVKTLHSDSFYYWNIQDDGQSWNIATDACEALKAQGFFGVPGGGKVDVGNFKCTAIGVEQQPKHGSLSRQSDGTFTYTPTKGYIGSDRVTFIVEAEGRKVRVVRDMNVQLFEPKEGETSQFPSGRGAITSWFRSSVLSALLADASGVDYQFGSLPGSAVGGTTADGNTAVVTIDDDAAGHGWFIDPTPQDNSEFLPTADPTIWQAKAGSVADGKMDMLSVLLHEYGHALGLEHSSDTHDFMAASLQPGERRLPNADEMALMARLVGELRTAESGQEQPGQPSAPAQPDPVMPTGNRSAGGQRLARRPSTPGTSSGNFEGAVNPNLNNRDFGSNGTTGWVAEGDIAVGTNAVTLGESATGQTHLAQGFMVSASDRLLSFTVDARTLVGNAIGPGDAFEAALLDANTGLPMTGTIGLSHSDALLNIQGDGTERLAAGVRKVLNTDGSATYYIDLAAALAGTPVLLCFDLLGFGAAASHVTLRDIRLQGALVASGGDVALDEDTAASGNLRVGDAIFGTPSAQAQLLDGPAHGQLDLSGSGSFIYQPDADFNGADSFSYQWVDPATGLVSNIATVNLQIASVNDAPLAALDVNSLGEDAGALVVSAEQGVLQGTGVAHEGRDTDIEKDTLTVLGVAIGLPTLSPPLTGLGIPQAGTYGSLTLNADGSYRFELNANAQVLPAGGIGKDVFTYAVGDGQGGVSTTTLTITVLGANDAAIIGGAVLGSVSEDGVLASSGQLTVADVDTSEEGFIAQTLVGNYGQLTLDSSGVWTYALDNSAAQVQALVAGQQVIEHFAVRSADGTIATLAIKVNGSDDAAVIGGNSTGSVSEDGTLGSSGNLTIADPDAGQAGFIAQSGTSAISGTYGVLTLAADGAWSYALNNEAANVQALVFGQTVIDTFTVKSIDGTEHAVTISITGSDDAAVIGGTTTGSASEDGTLTSTGRLSIADPDAGQAGFVSQTASAGTYGSFVLNTAGDWTYTLNNSAANVQALIAGQVVIETFAVKSLDGTAKTVTIRITGSNDAATIGGSTTGSVREDGNLTSSGTLAVVDPDAGQSSFNAQTATSGTYGAFTLNAAGNWTYALNIGASVVQALKAGQVATDQFTVSSVDGTVMTVTITVTGANGAAVIGGSSTGALSEDGMLSATGTLTVIDPDTGEAAFQAQNAVAGIYGSFTLSAAGTWSYALNNSAAVVQALAAGQAVNDVFTVKSIDGTSKAVTISIAGANDAAVIGGTSTGAVSEDGALSATGTLTIADLDAGQSAFQTQTATAGTYGSLTLNAAGAWSYALNNSAAVVQALAAGQVVNDSFVVKSIDGTTKAVTIGITGANDAAVIGGTAGGAVSEDGTQSATGTLTVVDPDAGQSAFQTQTATAGTYGSFTLNAAGAWIYALNNSAAAVQALAAGQVVNDIFTVKSIDGTSKAVTINITGANDAPVARDLALSVVGNSAAAVALAATDVDNATATLSYVIVNAAQHGSVARQADGSWRYTPTTGYVGSDSFTYKATDGKLDSNVATVRVTVTAPPVSTLAIDLGVAGAFNVFALHNFISSGSDTEGAIAVGNDLTLSNYSVNALGLAYHGLSAVVGGSLSFYGGSLHGTATYGASQHSGQLSNGDVVRKASPDFSFANEATRLTALSDQVATLATTGSVTVQGGGLTFTGDGKSAVQVFSISGAQLMSASVSNFAKLSPGQTVIVNVTGSAAGFSGGTPNGFGAYNTLFNFSNAQTLSFNNVGVWGSILAPRAQVNGGGGQINGNVIVKDWNSGVQINANHYFQLVSVTLGTSPKVLASAVHVPASASQASREALSSQRDGPAVLRSRGCDDDDADHHNAFITRLRTARPGKVTTSGNAAQRLVCKVAPLAQPQHSFEARNAHQAAAAQAEAKQPLHGDGDGDGDGDDQTWLRALEKSAGKTLKAMTGRRPDSMAVVN